MKTIWTFIINLFAIIGLVRKQVQTYDDTSKATDWNPFVAASVERERQTMILRKLRSFFKRKPRSWLSPNARATKLKEQRANVRKEIEKRLHSRRGLQ